jgi:hypothetical protein
MANDSSTATLGDVARLLARPEHLPEHWPLVAVRIAELLGAKHCAIVLAGGGQAVRAYGCAGAIRVHKAASAMLAPQADGNLPVLRYDAPAKAMFMPVCVDGMVLGVLHVQGNMPFTDTHFDTSEVVALLIGKALHLRRLQTILHSRFAQLALLQHPAAAAIALRHSRDTATLMAKAFYKEMANAGFAPPDIIGAASDIIGELTNTLKHADGKTTSAELI